MRPTSFLLSGLVCGALLSIGSASLHAESKTASHAASKAPRVEIAQAKIQSIGQTYHLNGKLIARKHVRLFSQEEGRIIQAPYYEGDAVKKDQLLVTLDDRLLKAELRKADASVEQAKLDVARLTKLRASKLSSEDELARARTALKLAQAEAHVLRTRLSYTRINAPFDGIISQRQVEPGDAVAKHTLLFTLLDPKSLVLRVRVAEWLFAQLHTDDKLTANLNPALNPSTQATAHTVTARIQRLFPEISEDSHRGTFEAQLSNIPANARAGQRVQVQLQTASRDRLIIPIKALRHSQQGGQDRTWVYRLHPDNTIQRTPVTTGQSFTQGMEILRGLKAEDHVVIRGFLGLQDGQSVRY